jgi:hypothetical protein
MVTGVIGFLKLDQECLCYKGEQTYDLISEQKQFSHYNVPCTRRVVVKFIVI